MEALKNHVETYIKNGGKIKYSNYDYLLAEIKKIVGERWATNDEAITVTYSHDLSAISDPKVPDYVVMPNTKEEISSLVKLFNKNKITYTIRGNGQNLLGFAINEGAIIDLNRMKTIEFDEKNWLVKVGRVLQLLIFRNKPRKEVTGSTHRSLLLFCVPILCARNNVYLFNYLWNKCRQLY